MATDLKSFLEEWYNESPKIKVQTSGSTGKPKEILVEKSRMIESAKATCKFLNLNKGETALLCMSLDYIAGKMMVVRALVAELNLIVVPPSGHPLKLVDQHIDFVAMVPLQIYNTLQVEEEKAKLSVINNIIIGGGAIDCIIEEQLQSIKGHVWSTYGMTETLSHIAMRAVNGPKHSLYYQPLQGIKIRTNKQNQLMIHAPKICEEILTTNDIVEMNKNGGFRILGRKDNVICTGGIKVLIEDIEAFLMPYMRSSFAISSIYDKKFGEAIILVVENKTQDIDNVIKKMPKYWKPKFILEMQHIPMTETGKKARAEIKKTANILLSGKIK
jgi:o-succinylbenzoate---CoA ligase